MHGIGQISRGNRRSDACQPHRHAAKWHACDAHIREDGSQCARRSLYVVGKCREVNTMPTPESPRVPLFGRRDTGPSGVGRTGEDAPAGFRVAQQVRGQLIQVIPLGAIRVPADGQSCLSRMPTGWR